MVEDTISSFDKGKVALFQKVAQREEKASVESVEVFHYLKEAVLKQA